MRAILIGACISAMSSAALAVAPEMSIGSIDTKLSQTECIARAKDVLRGAGLTKNFEAFEYTVYGETGEYTAAIRCEAANGLALFVVAGPSVKRSGPILKQIKDAFGSSN